MPAPITSRQHPLCKQIRALHDARQRRSQKLFVAEGGNAVAAALRARWPLQALIVPDTADGQAWADLAAPAGIDVRPVTLDLLEYLGEAQTTPDVIALAALPAPAASVWRDDSLVLLLDGIGDPGNVGTLIRSADAAGAGAVTATASSADPFGPKAVRATAGSLFTLPPTLLDDASPAALAAQCAALGIPIVAAVAHDGIDCFQYRWPRRCALALGHETRGLSPDLEAAATARVTIPMYGRAESLNVAAAGAVLLYAWRQFVDR